MKNLVLIGAGGCGRETLQWARDMNKLEQRWNIKGFIDDDMYALNEFNCNVPILDTVDGYEIDDNDEFVCCIGDSKIRENVARKLKAKGARFVTMIHPSAIIADNCIIGEGVIIYPYALISDHAEIGDGCIINMYSSVAHDSMLGNFCTISAHCDVTGMCRLGERVFMGTTSNMAPGVKIGNDAYICAGSTVMSRVRDGIKVMGIPARIIKF